MSGPAVVGYSNKLIRDGVGEPPKQTPARHRRRTLLLAFPRPTFDRSTYFLSHCILFVNFYIDLLYLLKYQLYNGTLQIYMF